MSIIDGICLAFIEGNCYNSSNIKESGGTESWYQLKHRLLVLNLIIA